MDNISNSYTAHIDRKDRENSNSAVYKVIIIFLTLFLLAIVLLLVGIFKDVSYIPANVKEVILDTLVCPNCEKEEKEELLAVKNAGSALYLYPEYGISVELPSYSSFNDEFKDNSSYRYVWSIYAYKADEGAPITPSIFDSYEKSIRIKYFPQEMPDIGCGGGCLKESMIGMDIYKNKERLDLEEAKELFITYITSSQKEFNDEETYDIQLTEISGKEAFSFSYKAGMGDYKGDVVITDDFITVISQYIFSTGTELEVVGKVLDSISFE